MNVAGSPNSRRSCPDLPYEGSQLGDAHGFGDLDRVSSSPPQRVTTGYSPGRLGLWRQSSSPLRGATTRRASAQRSGPTRPHRRCERPQPHSLGLCQPCDPCPHHAPERSQRAAVVGLSDVLGSPHRPSEGSQPLRRGGGQHLPPCRHRPSDGSQSGGHSPHGLLDCAGLINPERCHNLSPCFLAADTVPGSHRPSEGSQPVVLATLVGEFARPHRPCKGSQPLNDLGGWAAHRNVLIDPTRGHNRLPSASRNTTTMIFIAPPRGHNLNTPFSVTVKSASPHRPSEGSQTPRLRRHERHVAALMPGPDVRRPRAVWVVNAPPRGRNRTLVTDTRSGPPGSHRPSEGSQRIELGIAAEPVLVSSSPLRGVTTSRRGWAARWSRAFSLTLRGITMGRCCTSDRPASTSSSALQEVTTGSRSRGRTCPPGPHRPSEGHNICP